MSLKGKVPPELKIQAVEDYLSGGGSLDTMCRKYGISAHAVLQQWITLYLEAENKRLQRENDFLKKLKEIERR